MNSEADNRLVWDRLKAGHYEVWYSTFNHRSSGTGFWIRYTLESPLPGHGDPCCQLWFAFFDAARPGRNLAINRKFPLREFSSEDSPFGVQLGESTLAQNRMKGSLAGDTHAVSWNLTYQPALFTHYHLPAPLYRTHFADTKVLSPNLIMHLFGEVTVDGETYDFEGEPGCQTHLWGRKHAHAWAWSHCNTFREDPTACLETLSIKLHRLGIVMPTMTLLSLYLGSEVYHLQEFPNIPFNRGKWETGLYRFSGVGRRIKIVGEMRCRPEDLVQATYHDPDGELSFCHNTEVADASLTFWIRRGLNAPFKKVGRLTSRRTAHFEYAGRSPDGHVLKKHVTLPPGPING
jgi:hypothetical protein